MPELAAPRDYKLPVLVFQPINPATYFDRTPPQAPTIDTTKASEAGAFGALANAASTVIGGLPQVAREYPIKAQQRAVQSQALDLVNDSLSGKPMSEDQKAALAGITIGGDGRVSYNVPGQYAGALAKLQLDAEKKKVEEADARIALNKAHAKQYDTLANGGRTNPYWQSLHDQYSAANGEGGDVYKFDPNTGAVVSNGSYFGGVKDVTSGQDNGMFAAGGASIQKQNEKGEWVPIEEKDLDDVKAHPEKYRDNPEHYAAFPKWVYDSGAVQPGDKVKVAAVRPDGTRVWDEVTARDVGPAERTGRGFDANKAVLETLGIKTDDPVEIYLPNHKAIASRINGAAPGSDVLTEDGGKVTRSPSGDYVVQYPDGSSYLAPRHSKTGSPIISKTHGGVKYSADTMKLIGESGYTPKPGESESDVIKNARAAREEAGVVPHEKYVQYARWENGLRSHPLAKEYFTAEQQMHNVEASLSKGLTPAAALGTIDAYVKAMRGGAATQGMTKILEEAQPMIQRLRLKWQGLTGGAMDNGVLTQEMADDVQHILSRITEAAKERIVKMREGEVKRWRTHGVPAGPVRASFEPILNNEMDALSPLPEGDPQLAQGGTPAPAVSPANPTATAAGPTIPAAPDGMVMVSKGGTVAPVTQQQAQALVAKGWKLLPH